MGQTADKRIDFFREKEYNVREQKSCNCYQFDGNPGLERDVGFRLK